MNCTCGHPAEDHWHEWEHCNIAGCDCKLYEPDQDELGSTDPQMIEEEWEKVWR